MGSGKSANIWDALNFGFETLKSRPGMMLGFGVVLLLLEFALGGALMAVLHAIEAAPKEMRLALGVLALFVCLLMTGLAICVICGAFVPGFFTFLSRESKGEPFAFSGFFTNQRKFFSAFAAIAASLLVIAGGTLCFVVPGVVLAPVLPLSLYLVWRGNSGLQAPWKSIRLIFSNWLAALCILLAMLVAGIGIFLAFFSILVPVSLAAIWHLCEQLCDENPAPSSETPAQL